MNAPDRRPPAQWSEPQIELTVACPYCKRGPGDPCRTNLGEQVAPHQSRLVRALQARRDSCKNTSATPVAWTGRCVLCKRLPREHGELCEPCWEAGQDWMRDEEREATE